MSLRLYMDVHVRRAITVGLRYRGIDVLTSQEDGTATSSDSDLMSRATYQNRILFSHDTDMLREAARRQLAGIDFSGLVFAEQLGITVGQCIQDLHLIGELYDPADMINRVEFLPLK